MKLTWNSGNILPKQLSNKSSNIGQAVYEDANKNNYHPQPIVQSLKKNSPNQWNSINKDQGFNPQLTKTYLDQAKWSQLYQDEPWNVLTYSTKFGTEPLGGEIRNWLPSGSKPYKD